MLQSQWRTIVKIDGKDLGDWDSFNGGEKQNEVVAHRPGGFRAERKYAAPARYQDVTIGRVYETDRDHERVVSWIQSLEPARAEILRQPLDPDGRPFGRSQIYRGWVSNIDPGEADSDNDALSELELTVSVDEVA